MGALVLVGVLYQHDLLSATPQVQVYACSDAHMTPETEAVIEAMYRQSVQRVEMPVIVLVGVVLALLVLGTALTLAVLPQRMLGGALVSRTVRLARMLMTAGATRQQQRPLALAPGPRAELPRFHAPHPLRTARPPGTRLQ
jgi:hypothetical protein